jgi:hypothetical protein
MLGSTITVIYILLNTMNSATHKADSDTKLHTVNSIEWPGPNWAALEYSTDASVETFVAILFSFVFL